MPLCIEAEDEKNTIYFSNFFSKKERVKDKGIAVEFEDIAAGSVLADKEGLSKTPEDLHKDPNTVYFVFTNGILKVDKGCVPEGTEPVHKHGLVFINYSESAKSGQSQ